MAVKLDEVSYAYMRCVSLHAEVSTQLSADQVVDTLVALFDAHPPLTPSRFDPYGPVRTKYTLEAFEGLKGNPDIKGHLLLRGPGKRGELTHYFDRSVGDDGEYWIYEFDRSAIPWAAIEGAARVLAALPLTLATLHLVSQHEEGYCRQIGAGWSQGKGFSFKMESMGQRAFGLPTLAWRTYFGPMYIRHFGRERLLSAPAYAVREVHPDVISIQLTESIDTIGSDWDRFHATRQAVIAHLGADSFQRVRGPGDPPPMGEFDRNGVPGSSVPTEMLPLRHKMETECARERRRQQPTEPIRTLDELLAVEPERFRVVLWLVDKGRAERILVDDYRRETIRFPDAATRNQYVDALLAAGAEFQDLARNAEWTRQCRPQAVDGFPKPGEGERHNTRLLSGGGDS